VVAGPRRSRPWRVGGAGSTWRARATLARDPAPPIIGACTVDHPGMDRENVMPEFPVMATCPIWRSSTRRRLEARGSVRLVFWVNRALWPDVSRLDHPFALGFGPASIVDPAQCGRPDQGRIGWPCGPALVRALNVASGGRRQVALTRGAPNEPGRHPLRRRVHRIPGSPSAFRQAAPGARADHSAEASRHRGRSRVTYVIGYRLNDDMVHV